MHSNLVKDVCVCGPMCAWRKHLHLQRHDLGNDFFLCLFSNRFSWLSFFPFFLFISCCVFTFSLFTQMHAVWSGCFILVAYIPWTRVLFSPTHTHTLSSPQHLVPCAPKSVFMILPGSPFHFASLYLSHIALKIEGNWARRWEEEYPCWDSFWTSAKHTRTYTHAQTSSTHISSSFYLILEGLRAGKES